MIRRNIAEHRLYSRSARVQGEGKTHKEIAKEHGVNERTTQRWIAAYIKKGIEGVQICRSSRSKSSITDEDREIIGHPVFQDMRTPSKLFALSYTKTLNESCNIAVHDTISWSQK
jgi:transposase-like protein